MRANRAALAALLGVALSSCAGAPEPAAPPPRAERPTYELADKWIRNDGIYELTRIENGLYVFAGATGREILLTRDLTIARAYRRPTLLEFLSPPTLPWPLQIGQRGGSFGQLVLRGLGWSGSGG